MNGHRRRWCYPAKRLLEQFPDDMWANTIAERLGTTRSTIQRWRDVDVRFDVYGADKWAVRLGKHPSQIWPEWFDLPECTYRQRQRIMKGTGLA